MQELKSERGKGLGHIFSVAFLNNFNEEKRPV
jgi:hypothetical protein